MTDTLERRALQVTRDTGHSRPQHDMDRASSALAALAASDAPDQLRLYRPQPTAAFSRRDTLTSGYPDAHAAAVRHGFTPVVRPVGGRLAAYHQGALVFDLAARALEPRGGIRQRFIAFGQALAAALAHLGLDARVGGVRGEYCPGEFSVNARGKTKLVGTAQRLTRHGFLFSGVLLIENSNPIRSFLCEAYSCIGMNWHPSTLGCINEEVPGVTAEQVEESILASLLRCLEASYILRIR